MPSFRDVISACRVSGRDWLSEAVRLLAPQQKQQVKFPVNVDLGNGWRASRSLMHTYDGQQLLLTYVDPDRVLDTMMFRKVVSLKAQEQELDLCWASLAYFAEDYVRQQLLGAYERTIRDIRK